MQYHTILEAEVPQVKCDEHGVLLVDVPWAEPGSGYTAMFESVVIDWLLRTDLQAVAQMLDLSWGVVDRIMQRAVARGLARREELYPVNISVDETSFQKRHEYVTVLTDQDSSRVLYVADDRTTQSLDGFYKTLNVQQCEGIRSVAMDMWPAFIRATLESVPDAHSQAPTAGSVLLAGVLLKTGAYGLIRFAIPLFPEASANFAPVAMTIAVIGILYCAKLAFAQTDIKRLIAYTSVSHMGFVLLSVYAWNLYGLQGALMIMLTHGLTSSALFMLAGGLQHRFHTRDMRQMSGLWAKLPKMSAMALFFSIAALGMPGLGNFIGEFLSLLGAFQANHMAAIFAALGLIFASVYSLWVIQRVFHGEYKVPDHGVGHGKQNEDLTATELVCYGAMAVGLVWMGMYPQTFLALSEPTMNFLLGSLDAVVSSVVSSAGVTGEVLP